jgi:hypothetical protein
MKGMRESIYFPFLNEHNRFAASGANERGLIAFHISESVFMRALGANGILGKPILSDGSIFLYRAASATLRADELAVNSFLRIQFQFCAAFRTSAIGFQEKLQLVFKHFLVVLLQY